MTSSTSSFLFSLSLFLFSFPIFFSHLFLSSRSLLYSSIPSFLHPFPFLSLLFSSLLFSSRKGFTFTFSKDGSSSWALLLWNQWYSDCVFLATSFVGATRSKIIILIVWRRRKCSENLPRKYFLHLNLLLILKFRENCSKTTLNLSLILPRIFSQVFMALYIVLKIFRQFWTAYFFQLRS